MQKEYCTIPVCSKESGALQEIFLSDCSWITKKERHSIWESLVLKYLLSLGILICESNAVHHEECLN